MEKTMYSLRPNLFVHFLNVQKSLRLDKPIFLFTPFLGIKRSIFLEKAKGNCDKL